MPQKFSTKLLILANLLLLLLIGFVLYDIFSLRTAIKGQRLLSSNGITITPTKQLSQVFTQTAKIYYVDPAGSDSSSGTTSSTAFKTIQTALDIAVGGDTIILGAGVYKQDIKSVRDGSKDRPITLSGARDSIVKGSGGSHIIEINNNYITLQGFTVDGLFGDRKSADGYRDKLVYVQGKNPKNGVTGLKVMNMVLKNAAGECVRLRYFAHNNEISQNTIGPCGVADFKFPSDNKNGEGIYLGTSSEQWSDGKNPTADPDISTHNWIHHNNFDTQGNECVDIKEGATENIVEYNTCTGQLDAESGGFDSRGDANIFRYNTSTGNLGAGIRLGGHTVNGIIYGKNNQVYENTIANNKNGGIKFEVLPQSKVCENIMSGNIGGNAAGSKAKGINPTSKCK